MKRIFIAIKVETGETLKRMISSMKADLAGESIKWTDPDNIHITLAFMGDTEAKMIKAVSVILKEKCEGTGKFDLIIRGAGVFKNIRDPRVIWTGIDLSEKLIQLNLLIKEGLTTSGIIIENRPFKPHLTLGRIRTLRDKELLNKIIDEYQNKEIQKEPVNEVILYESILLPQGALYKPLFKFKL
jgi:RNA 2',3'-cyclic 3'-phosphodiesterase